MKKLIAVFALIGAGIAHAATLSPVQLLNPAGSIAGHAIVSTGPNSSPGWASVVASSLAPVAANTVIGNFTGASASPAANAVPSCSTANSALKYTTSSGLSCGTTFALTSGNLSQFASTTSAQLAAVLSDETGSGAAVFGTSPTLSTPAITGGTLNNAVIGGVTPAAGIFTTLTATGAFTPSQTAGIVGTTTNNDANAGSVGEYLRAFNLNVSATSGSGINATSISLGAGDWDVDGLVQTNPAGTTTTSVVSVGVSATSNTFSLVDSGAFTNVQTFAASVPAGQSITLSAPTTRLRLASTTTVYVVTQANFAVSTMTVSGFIRARRVR